MVVKILLLSMMILVAASMPARAMQTEDIMVPTEGKGFFGFKTYRLATYIHKPDDFDPERKYPVVIINHGTPANLYTRRHTRFDYRNASEYFLERGFVVVVPMRRGYGGSDGVSIPESIDSCRNPDYSSSAREATKDITAVINFVKSLAYADKQNILLVGISSGGFTSLATASLNIEGVIGVINFAGGQGGSPRREYPRHVCNEQRLIEVMGSYGKAKVPTLWIYSENDSFFRPALAHAMFEDFSRNGGTGKLVIAPPLGHALLNRPEAIKIWSPLSDEFLYQLRGGDCCC